MSANQRENGNVRRTDLSFCEELVISILWDAAEPLTCSEIINHLGTRYNIHYKDTTVYTFLKNLEEKGYITRYKRGVTFFTAAKSKDDYVHGKMLEIEDIWFQGDKQEACRYMNLL